MTELARVEVLRTVPSTRPNTLAVVSVRIGDITINEITVNRTSFFGTYVNLPCRKRDQVWMPIVETTTDAQ